MHVAIATRRNELDELGCSDRAALPELLGSPTRRANCDPAVSGADLRVARHRQFGSVAASQRASYSRPELPAFVEKAMHANWRHRSPVPN